MDVSKSVVKRFGGRHTMPKKTHTEVGGNGSNTPLSVSEDQEGNAAGGSNRIAGGSPEQQVPQQSAADAIINAKDPSEASSAIEAEIEELINKSGLREKYDFLFLYDSHDPITRYTADQIYSALPPHQDKGLLLILYSNGGGVEPAYLISKCCKTAGNSFHVAVPRFAKSAATLIALGADGIHMGIISELGPIDPQVGKYPALALRSALQHITTLVEEHTQASDMFARYLASQLDLRDLGYLERVSESAVQYAVRLLASKRLGGEYATEKIAHKLVYEYKDHGFVIDREEARQILGTEIVQFDTPEYKLASSIHRTLNTVDMICEWIHKKRFKVIGTIHSGITYWSVD